MTAALNKVLMPLFGRGPRVRHADKAADHAVNVTRDETMPAEAYRLFVTPCRIDIVAGGAQGERPRPADVSCERRARS